MKLRAILTSSLGNVLEWYDFGLYAALSPVFAELFFPSENHIIAILKVFMVFALGFLIRPIGGIFFGHFGDKLGRVKTLRATIFFMSFTTGLMAFLPTYQQIGLFAPLILIVLRLLQGFSLGGEFTGIIIYLTEIAPRKHRALTASFAGTAANIGILAANMTVLILHQLLTQAQMMAFGWRIAFLIGGLFGFSIFYFRFYFIETHTFQELLKHHQIKKVPLLETIKHNPLILLRTVSLVMLGSVLYYSCFIYMTDYLVRVQHLSETVALAIQNGCLTAMLFLVPLGGFICDRIGRKQSFLVISGAMTILIVGCFHYLNHGSLTMVLIAMAIVTLISSFEQGTTSATVVEQFPAAVRYSGIALSYNLTQALLGGTAPAVMTLLILHFKSNMAPAYYLLIISVITFMSVLFFLPKGLEKKVE